MQKKLLISALLIFLVQLSYIKVVDKTSSQQLDNALVRSLSVFAVARGLNGLISVVQGTEVYATPAGVGVNFAVGQIVDPMNDMLERFSWVMLLSSVSLGIQKLLLEFSQTGLSQALLACSALVLLFILWIPKLWHKQGFNLVFKSFVIFTFLRFFIPFVVLINEGIYTYMLEEQYLQAESSLSYSKEEISGEIKRVQALEKESKSVQKTYSGSFWEQGKEYFDTFGDSFNIQMYYQKFQKKLDKVLTSLQHKFNNAINDMLSLIAIFIMQSVLLPLLFLWAFIKLFQNFFRYDFASFLDPEKS